MYQTIHKIMLKKCKEFTKIQKYWKYIKNSTKVQIYQIQGSFQAFSSVVKKYEKVQNYKNYRFCTEVQLPGMSGHVDLSGILRKCANTIRPQKCLCVSAKTYQRLTENVQKLSATRIVISREPSELQAPDFVCVLTRF